MISPSQRLPSKSLGFRFITSISSKVFLIGLYALRFKKLDERKRSCNQRTNQVDNFRNQRELPGIQSICNIEAGYVLDPFGMSISGFHLVCPNGSGKPYWDVELRETQETAIITDLFDHSGREDADSPPASYRKKNAGIILPFSRREKNDQDP